MTDSDVELVDRMATDRDADAFSRFYARFSAKVYGLLLTLLRNQTDADDVLQETFLQVWRQANRFDPTRSVPEGWLMMLARSRAMDRLRRRPTCTPSAHSQDTGVWLDPCRGLELQESSRLLRSGIAGLPTEQADPIRLAFYEGYTHEEIARLLAIPLGTVKTRIRLGMIELRNGFRRKGMGYGNDD